jgi:hypothetical protein
MSLAAWKNQPIRRVTLILITPLYVPLVLVLGALMGVLEQAKDIPDDYRAVWRGRGD